MTSLKQVRKEAARTILGLRSGKVSPIIADAIYKQSISVIESYRVELQAIRLAVDTTPERLDYSEALRMISK